MSEKNDYTIKVHVQIKSWEWAPPVSDVCYFGPKPEFFVFDSVTWSRGLEQGHAIAQGRGQKDG